MKREQWQKNFSMWFNQILRRADIMDTRYPVKGLYVWLPYGLKLRNHVLAIIRRLLEETSHQEVLFPLLIPKTIFEKEAQHIRGFEDEVYWVTHGGSDELDVKLALRPTSETSIYPMFKLWIRSHADLPLRTYQVVNVFRYETKATKPMIRLREVTTFKEAHTAHDSWEDAEKQVQVGVKIYKQFFDELGIPYTITRRPPWDTFAGAEYSIAFDTLAPDGRTLQIGTVHNLGQNFAKVYDLTYETPKGEHKFIYQTCYGISDRVIASVIMVHGDDRGLCLPPTIAPIQAVIVPIPYRGKETTVQKTAEEIRNKLEKAGIRVHLDNRDLRPGDKFYRWERRGVPVRLEIGPQDVEKKQITAVRRDTGKKTQISKKDIVPGIKKMFNEITKNLKKRTREFINRRTHEVDNAEAAKRAIGKKGGIVRIPWCGKESCGLKLEEQTGADILGQEIEGKKSPGKCCICGKKTETYVLMAKTY